MIPKNAKELHIGASINFASSKKSLPGQKASLIGFGNVGQWNTKGSKPLTRGVCQKFVNVVDYIIQRNYNNIFQMLHQ